MAAPVEHSSSKSIFASIAETAPGMPWEQRSAAYLEARLGGPLRSELLTVAVRRLDPWRPRSGARFLTVAGRTRELRQRVELEVKVDERPVRISLTPASYRHTQVWSIYGPPLVLGAAASLTILCALVCGGEKTSVGDRLDALTTQVRHEAATADRLRNSARDYAFAAHVSGTETTTADFLSEIAFVAAHKARNASVYELLWEDNDVGLVSAGPSSPLNLPPRMKVVDGGGVGKDRHIWGFHEVGGGFL